jgi:hypothetical protein
LSSPVVHACVRVLVKRWRKPQVEERDEPMCRPCASGGKRFLISFPFDHGGGG